MSDINSFSEVPVNVVDTVDTTELKGTLEKTAMAQGIIESLNNMLAPDEPKLTSISFSDDDGKVSQEYFAAPTAPTVSDTEESVEEGVVAEQEAVAEQEEETAFDGKITGQESLIKSQKTHIELGSEYVGCFLSWRIHDNTRVTYVELMEKAKEHGISRKHLPLEKKPGKAFSDTVAAFNSRGEKRPAGYRLKALRAKATGIRMIGLMKDTAETDELLIVKAGVKQVATFSFDIKEEKIAVMGTSVDWQNTANEIKEELKSLYEECRHHGKSDIHGICQSFCEYKAVIVNSGSSAALRFIPSAFFDEAVSLGKFVADISPLDKEGDSLSNFCTIPQYAALQPHAISKEIQSIIQDEINSLLADVIKFENYILYESNPQSDFGKRIENRINQFADAKDKIVAYKEKFPKLETAALEEACTSLGACYYQIVEGKAMMRGHRSTKSANRLFSI